MKTSIYNLLLDDHEGGGAVLYNTLRGSLTTIDRGEVPLVEKLLEDPGKVDPALRGMRDTLVAQGHLVDDDYDELAVVQERKRRGVADPNRLDVVVMPTLACNFACIYCYESKHPSRMTDDVAVALRAWLSAEVPRTKFVMLHWFGGEPLLEHRRVVEVTRHLAETAEAHNVGHVAHVTTNGYLLDGERRSALLDAGIRDYQITVDGPEGTHDRLRPQNNGRGSFDRVFTNIQDTALAEPSVRITLRVNFNHTNVDSIPRLLELVDPTIRGQLRVVLEPIFGSADVSAKENLAGDAISRALAENYALAALMGFDARAGATVVRAGKLVYCYGERERQAIINYNGDVFKCSVGSFSPTARLGRLDANGTIRAEGRRLDEWLNRGATFDAGCLACVYLPLCMGGCLKTRLAQGSTGDQCALVPTNAGHVLKQIAFSGFDTSLLSGHSPSELNDSDYREEVIS